MVQQREATCRLLDEKRPRSGGAGAGAVIPTRWAAARKRELKTFLIRRTFLTRKKEDPPAQAGGRSGPGFLRFTGAAPGSQLGLGSWNS
jgi:hypothetical protein